MWPRDDWAVPVAPKFRLPASNVHQWDLQHVCQVLQTAHAGRIDGKHFNDGNEIKIWIVFFLCETQSKIFFEFAIYQNAIHGTGLCKDTNMELLHIMLVLIWGPWLMVMMAMMVRMVLVLSPGVQLVPRGPPLPRPLSGKRKRTFNVLLLPLIGKFLKPRKHL